MELNTNTPRYNRRVMIFNSRKTSKTEPPMNETNPNKRKIPFNLISGVFIFKDSLAKRIPVIVSMIATSMKNNIKKDLY